MLGDEYGLEVSETCDQCAFIFAEVGCISRTYNSKQRRNLQQKKLSRRLENEGLSDEVYFDYFQVSLQNNTTCLVPSPSATLTLVSKSAI